MATLMLQVSGWAASGLIVLHPRPALVSPLLVRAPTQGHCVQSNNYLVRYPSMTLQAASASVKDLKGEPPTLMAHLF
jgi:hypothetical protein